jgi:hypothetical protein
LRQRFTPPNWQSGGPITSAQLRRFCWISSYSQVCCTLFFYVTWRLADSWQFSCEVWLDEAGVLQDTHCRTHAWARRGRRTTRIPRQNDAIRINPMPAVSLDGLLCLIVQAGSMNRLDFEYFLEEVLVSCSSSSIMIADIWSIHQMPCMNPYPGWNSVLVMDNHRIHHGGRIREICKQNHVLLMYLQPYSPDFNPIEKVFLVLKSRLKRAQILNGNWGDTQIIKCFLPTFVTPCLMWSLYSSSGYA